uniref:hypothetical protein n=1 Tax=Bifidobacterium adolescentis TaxID=1680 RepID=UPI00359C1BB4
MAYFAELSASGLEPVRFEGSGDLDCLCIAKGGIEGWWSTPAAKVNVTARGQGDGGHDVSEDDISYASRTVTLHWNANASSRDALLALTDSVRRLVHRQVRMRVVDGTEDTCCSGGYMVLTQQSDYRSGSIADSTITIVFERPERLSSTPQRYQLLPSIESDHVGLSYGDSGKGLAYPLSYGKAAVDARNVCTLTNNGSSRAYPVFTVQGPWPNGVQLTFPGLNMSLDYAQAVGNVPLVLDSRSRTASIGGLDVSRNLRQRGFPIVQPGGSLAVNLQSIGNGYVSVECHDTYM